MVLNHLTYPVCLKDVFPEEKPSDIGNYLKGISKRSVLLGASALLSRKELLSTEYNKIVIKWFGNNNPQYEILSKLKQLEGRIKQHIIIVTPQSALKLFEYAFNNLHDNEDILVENINLNIFKAILYQNELLSYPEEILERSLKETNVNLKPHALFFTNIVRFFDVSNFHLPDIFIGEFVKAILFFNYFYNNDKYKPHFEKFNNYFSVVSWQDYLKKILSISFLILKKDDDNHLELLVEKDENFNIINNFLTNLSNITYDDTLDYDFKAVRENPLLRLNDGHFRIISELFAIEKLFKGLYFIFKKINDTLPGHLRVDDYRREYTFEFSEKFVLYQILDKAFSNKFVKISGNKFSANRIDAAPDFYLRKYNKVFLFESKDVLLNAKIKESCDFSLIEPELIKKFLKSDRDSKAVLQLIYSIKDVLDGLYLPLDENCKINIVKIYPIIIIHDRQLDVPGLNKILNFWFLEEIKKLDLKFSFNNVRLITLIDISTLIQIHELIQDKKILLEDLIDQYHKYIDEKQPNQFRSQKDYEQHLIDSEVTFSFFIKKKLEKLKLDLKPKRMMIKAANLAFSDVDKI